ncbi:MAG: GMC family oxidoreductase [Planctomycetes bacterium]|nr:GMC family oxidoreductase [Planctomycetota bacterium]
MDLHAEDCVGRRWDAVVVGGGLGGCAAAWSLARAGWSVLVLERGPDHGLAGQAVRGRLLPEPLPGEDTAHLAAGGRDGDPVLLDDGRHRFHHIPFLGTGSGGSSALYGAALERFQREDLQPRGYHPRARGSDLPAAWPFTLEDLAPWYELAEQRLGVVGGEPLAAGALGGLDPANARLARLLLERGLPLHRLRLGDRDDGARGRYQGMLCPRGRKHDGARAFLDPARDHHRARLLDRCRVRRIEFDAGRAVAVVAERDGAALRIEAGQVLLAAGALRTPALLLASPGWERLDRGGWTGRGLMRHFVDLHALRVGGDGTGQAGKELVCNRWYCADGCKLGTVQSFGPLPPAPALVRSLRVAALEEGRTLAAAGLAAVRPLAEAALGRVLAGRVVLASIVEDLPYAANRVTAGPDGTPQVAYRLHDEARVRIAAMRAHLKQAFAGLPHLPIPAAEDLRRLAHACGTCRAGIDPAASVVDPGCTAHGCANLHIVDASWMPSSGGTNPGLTIAANALRVAARLAGDPGGSAAEDRRLAVTC